MAKTLAPSPTFEAIKARNATLGRKRSAQQDAKTEAWCRRQEALWARQEAASGKANVPELLEFHRFQRRYPPTGALDALERFLALWPVGTVLDSNALYGEGKVLKQDTREVKEAICQLEASGVLEPLRGPYWRLQALPTVKDGQ